MAIVGEAHIIVRALTNNVARDIQQGFDGIRGSVGGAAGNRIGRSFTDGFNRSGATNVFGKIADGLRSLAPEAEGAADSFRSLVRRGYTVSTALSTVVGGIAAVVVALGSLIGALSAAAPAVMTLFNALISLRVGFAVVRFAMGGIGAAVSQATQANTGLGQSIRDVREEMQQLKFDAEEAALSEKRAALNLEIARNNLLRVQDLPPNSIARREAELAYEEAELAYRRAKDRSKDLQEDIADGTAGAAGGGGIDPYAGLTKSQKAFAKFLVSLKPLLDELKEAVAAGFLPILEKQIRRMISSLFPTLKRGLAGIAESMGIAAERFTDFLVQEENVKDLEKAFDNMRPVLEEFGTILGQVYSIILDLFNASSPATQRFLEFVSESLGNFAETIDKMEKSGELEALFDNAAAVAGQFGTILFNVVEGLGNLADLTMGEGGGGQILLDWLTSVSEGFKNLGGDTEESRAQTRKFFADATTNAISFIETIGAFIGEILKVADNPALKETFDTLKEGAPAFGSILTETIKAGPSFARLVVNIIKIIDLLTDEGAITTFFDTLNSFAEKLVGFLQDPENQKILEITGRVFAFFAAINLIFGFLRFGTFVLIGNLIKVTGLFSGVMKFFGFFKGGLAGIKQQFAFLTYSQSGFLQTIGRIGSTIMEPIKNIGKILKGGGILTIIFLLVDGFIRLMNTSEEFRTLVDNTLGAVGASFMTLFGDIGKLLGELFGPEGSLLSGIAPLFDAIMAFLQPIVDFVLFAIVPTLGIVIGTIVNVISFAVRIISEVVKVVADTIGVFVGGIVKIFQGDLVGGVTQMIGGILTFLVGIVQFVVNAVIEVINFFIDSYNLVVATFGGQSVSRLAPVDWTGDIAKRFAPKKYPTSSQRQGTGLALAEGGVVYPRMGGVMATIAEAGRPERVEPLDEDGLSRRDKAMIDYMSGGKGGMTINVYAAPGMSTNELVEKVSRKIAFNVRRGTI
jgi:phage-related protein